MMEGNNRALKEEELLLVKRRTLYAQVFGTSGQAYRRVSLASQDAAVSQSERRVSQQGMPQASSTEFDDSSESNEPHIRKASYTFYKFESQPGTPFPGSNAVSYFEAKDDDLGDETRAAANFEDEQILTSGNAHVFWALVQVAVEKVAARELAREQDPSNRDSEEASQLAIECAMDMPEAGPLSDPHVLDVLFEEDGFAKLCRGENSEPELQGKSGVSWEWWFDEEKS